MKRQNERVNSVTQKSNASEDFTEHIYKCLRDIKIWWLPAVSSRRCNVSEEGERIFTKSSCENSFLFNCQLITLRHFSLSQHFRERGNNCGSKERRQSWACSPATAWKRGNKSTHWMPSCCQWWERYISRRRCFDNHLGWKDTWQQGPCEEEKCHFLNSETNCKYLCISFLLSVKLTACHCCMTTMANNYHVIVCPHLKLQRPINTVVDEMRWHICLLQQLCDRLCKHPAPSPVSTWNLISRYLPETIHVALFKLL